MYVKAYDGNKMNRHHSVMPRLLFGAVGVRFSAALKGPLIGLCEMLNPHMREIALQQFLKQPNLRLCADCFHCFLCLPKNRMRAYYSSPFVDQGLTLQPIYARHGNRKCDRTLAPLPRLNEPVAALIGVVQIELGRFALIQNGHAVIELRVEKALFDAHSMFLQYSR